VFDTRLLRRVPQQGRLMIGYSIEDRGECRPVNGNPPDVGATVTCFRDRLVVVKVTARVTPPRGGVDAYFDVWTVPVSRRVVTV